MDMNLKKLGEEVRLRRKQKSMTLADLAEAIGSTPPTIRAIEYGKGSRTETVLKACDYLGIKVQLS